MKSKKAKDKLKAENSLDTSAEPESPKGLDKFKLKTKKDLKKPKKESKTSLKSLDSTTSNLSSNATFADRSLAETTVNVSAVNVSAVSKSPSFTKTYDYTEDEQGASKKRKPVGGFTYESNLQKSKESIPEVPTSPSKRTQGLAFNYAPGEAQKVAETAAEKRKIFMEKVAADSIKTPDGIKTPGFNYVQSAVHKEESVKKEPKISVETKVEPTGEIEFTKTVLEKKVTSASAETTIETEKKNVDTKLGISNKKSKDHDNGKGVLEKAMDRLGSFGKGSKIKTETELKKDSSDLIGNKSSKDKTNVDVNNELSDLGSDDKTVVDVKNKSSGLKSKGSKDKTVLDVKKESSDLGSKGSKNKNIDVKKESSDLSGKGPKNKKIDVKKELSVSAGNKTSNDKPIGDIKKELSDFIENEKKNYEDDKPLVVGTTPLIVKTTTKQTMIKDQEGVTQNIEEKVEDLTSGEVTVSTQHNKVIVIDEFGFCNIFGISFLFLFLHGFFFCA